MSELKDAMDGKESKSAAQLLVDLKQSIAKHHLMMQNMEKQLCRLEKHLEDEQHLKNPNMIRLVIKGLGEPFYVWVDRATKIKHLKPILYKHCGISPLYQKLMTDSALNLTDDTKSLQSYGLVSGNIIHILLPFRSTK